MGYVAPPGPHGAVLGHLLSVERSTQPAEKGEQCILKRPELPMVGRVDVSLPTEAAVSVRRRRRRSHDHHGTRRFRLTWTSEERTTRIHS